MILWQLAGREVSRLGGWRVDKFKGWEVGRLNGAKKLGWVNGDVVGLMGGLRKMGEGGGEDGGGGRGAGK